MAKTKSASMSHRGRKRANNEDFLSLFEPLDAQEQAVSGSLYIVADGVGGAARGERASQYAAEKLLYEYYNRRDIEPGERLRQIICQANGEIHDFAEQSTNISQMATTLVAAVVRGNMLTVANVGDSRAYLIRGGGAQQITRDHSIVGELMRDGAMTEAEAQASKVKNRLTRSLGGEAEVHVDIFPDIALQAGDKILLCTDGLTRYAANQDVVALTAEGTPGEIVQRLVDYANQRGGADNISVILVNYDPAWADTSVTATTQQMPQPVSWDTMQTLPELPNIGRGKFAKMRAALFQRRYIPYAVGMMVLLCIAAVVAWLLIAPPAVPTPVPSAASTITETPTIPLSSDGQPLDASVTPSSTQLVAVLVTDTPTPTLTPTYTPTPEHVCVVQVEDNSNLGMIDYLGKFSLLYDPLQDYYYCEISGTPPDLICQNKLPLQKNDNGPILNPFRWIIIPVSNAEVCVYGGGLWIPFIPQADTLKP